MFRHPELRFYFSLARELRMTVREMLEKMSSKEMAYWMAYFRIENEEINRKTNEAKALDNVRSKK